MPTCSVRDTVGSVVSGMGEWPVAVVVEGECVLGLLRAEDIADCEPSTPVASVMRPGPSTFRPSITCEEMADWLDENDRTRTVLTTLDGHLVGIVELDDLRFCR